MLFIHVSGLNRIVYDFFIDVDVFYKFSLYSSKYILFNT